MSDNVDNYEIGRHAHLFSSWAASRAASVKSCRFSVERGRQLLEGAGFTALLVYPDALPSAREIDKRHRKWRKRIIRNGADSALTFTDGIAAKLINIYLKSRVVCGGLHDDERVRQLHPPLDSVLLKALAKADVGGFRREWLRACSRRWSNLNCDEYEELIALVRKAVGNRPMWAIEAYWKGNR